MKITPLGQRVVVEPKAAEETTASGIIVAAKSPDKPMEGTVIAVGPDCKSVKAGDKVIFKQYSPTEFKHEDKEVYLLDEEDLLATIA